MKITKKEFADKLIKFIYELDYCPSKIGLKDKKNCVTDDCEDCWKQAIEQGVE